MYRNDLYYRMYVYYVYMYMYVCIIMYMEYCTLSIEQQMCMVDMVVQNCLLVVKVSVVSGVEHSILYAVCTTIATRYNCSFVTITEHSPIYSMLYTQPCKPYTTTAPFKTNPMYSICILYTAHNIVNYI